VPLMNRKENEKEAVFNQENNLSIFYFPNNFCQPLSGGVSSSPPETASSCK